MLLVTLLVQVEPCCWMTYTRHRDTRETLQILDRLDLDSDKPTEEEIMAKFGLDEQFRTSQLTCWQRVRPKIWLLFEEPNSTLAAKVRPLSIAIQTSTSSEIRRLYYDADISNQFM